MTHWNTPLTGRTGADLVLMGFSIKNTDGSTAAYYEAEQHLDPRRWARSLADYTRRTCSIRSGLSSSAPRWSKAVKSGSPDYRWGEDRLFIFDCLERAGSVAVLPECKYSYIMHPGQSLISSYYDKKFEVCLAADTRAQQLCRRFGAEDDEDFRYMFAKSVFSCLTTLFSPDAGSTAMKRETLSAASSQ